MGGTDPEVWRWVWLVAAFFFAVSEIAIAGSFFLAPFAIGAAVASVLAFLGVPVTIEWIVFVSVSIAALVAMRPLARKLDATGPVMGVGSHRQLGQRARVIEAIESEHDHGFVMLGSERWRAEAGDGEPIPLGATVQVDEVRGTRVIVSQVPDPAPTEI